MQLALHRLGLICLVASMVLCGCKPVQDNPALKADGSLAEGYSITDEKMTASQKKQFEAYMGASGGTLDFNDMPRDLRDALIASARKTTPTPRPDLSPAMAKFRFSNYLVSPDTTSPIVGTVDTPDGPKSLQNLKDRYYLVTVWATWCAPCINELKDFATLSRSLSGQNLSVVAVQSELNSPAVQSKTDQVLAKAGDLSGLEMWRDASPNGGAIVSSLKSGIPLTVLIGPDGKEIGRVSGAIEVAGGSSTIWAAPDTRDFMISLISNTQSPPIEAKSKT